MMNTILELNNWIDEIKSLEVNDINIQKLNNFIKFSPEKFADRLGIDRQKIVKEVDIHKREIHNKIIIFNKVKKLINREVKTFDFKYNNKTYKTIFCICTNFIEVKNIKFYPTITYLYCNLDDDKLVVFTDEKKVYISENEFNIHFIDLREYKINSLLSSTPY